MNVLIIGESCLDVYHYGDCSRLCPDAPVPVFESIHTIENGGMAQNVKSNVEKINPNLKLTLITNDNWTKIKKTRFVEEKSNHMFLRVDELDDKYNKLSDDLLENINFDNYDAVLVSDYNKGFVSIDQLMFISDKSKLSFIDTKRPIDSWIKKFSFIKLNYSEYLNSEKYLNQHNHNLIVTKGKLGCVYQNKNFPVEKVQVKDTSGAGDTFISGLVCEYLKTSDIVKSIKFAQECATIVVQKQGVCTI